MRGIASFIAGFGGGYVKAKDKEYDRERQEKLDAQANELHTAKMSEIVAAQDERQRERDFREANVAALSAGKTDTGQVVTDAAGSNAYTKDADAAAVLQDMAQTMNGGAQTAPATRVLTGAQGATQRGTIPGQQVFTDPAKAQEFAQSMPMTEYAKLKERQRVAEQYGKLEIADDMRTKLENLAQKGVFKAGSLLDAGNADGALKVLQDMNPDLVPKGAQFKQVDVPDMFDRTKTAKGWALVAPGAEGQPERVLVGDFRDAVFGYLTPQEQFTTKHTLNKSALDARKTEVAERQAATAERKIDLLLMGAGRSGGGGRGAEDATPQAFDPLGNFDSKKAQAVAFVQASAAVDANGKPLSPAEQGKLAHKLYRSMEDEFANENIRRQRVIALRNEASQATTQEEIEALRQRALARGYTPEEMVAIDKRFGPTKDASPTKNAGTNGKTNPDKPIPEKPAAAPYEPPSDSPAGRAKAAREAAQKAAQQQQMQKIAAVTKAASDALASKDPSAAQAVQDMPGFGSLPTAQKSEIRRIVFGR